MPEEVVDSSVVVEAEVVEGGTNQTKPPEPPQAATAKTNLAIKANLAKVSQGTKVPAIQMLLLSRCASPIGPLEKLRLSAGNLFLVLGSTSSLRNETSANSMH